MCPEAAGLWGDEDLGRCRELSLAKLSFPECPDPKLSPLDRGTRAWGPVPSLSLQAAGREVG